MLSSDVVRQLELHRIATTRRDGRRVMAKLAEPRALIELWTARYRWENNSALAVTAPIMDTDRFLRQAAKTFRNHRWALTLLAGAWQRIQHSPTETFHIYVECSSIAQLRAVAIEAGWNPDPSGRVFLMKPKYTTSVWHGLQSLGSNEVPVVSDLQLVLDLWHYPVRGREVADELWAPIERRFRVDADRLQDS